MSFHDNWINPLTQFILFPSDESDRHKQGDERKKRPRTAFTAEQIKDLEAEFTRNKYLSVAKRTELSQRLKLTETQVGKIED